MRGRNRRTCLSALFAVLVAAAIVAAVASAQGGTGQTLYAGCISETGTGGDCTDGKALDGPTAVTLTTDGAAVRATGTVSGTFAAAASLPGPASKRIVTVRAVRARDARIVAAQRIRSASGAYSLRLPADLYVLVADGASLKGGVAKSALSPLVQVKAGKRRTVPLGSTRSPARAGAAVKRIGIDPVMPVANSGFPAKRALAAMVTTDLVQFPCPNRTELEIDEVDRLEDILDELKLQRSPYVDPGTKVTPHIHRPDYMVRGGGSVSGSTLTLELRLVHIKTRRVTASASASGPADSWIKVVEQLDRKFALEACKPELPEAYVGTAHATRTTTGAAGERKETLEATNIRFELQSAGTSYALVRATVTWTLTGSLGACTMTGTHTFMLRGNEAYGAARLDFSRDVKTYHLLADGLNFGAERPIEHWVCPDEAIDVPALDGFAVWIDSDAPGSFGTSPRAIPADLRLSGSTSKIEAGPGGSVASQWEWSLTPEA